MVAASLGELVPIRVFVVAEDHLARAGLVALLREEVGLEVAGQAAPEDDLAHEVQALRVEGVLWDLGWDPVQSLARLVELAEELPPVLALVSTEAVAMGDAARAWRAGARGLLSRDADAEQMTVALRSLARGLWVVQRSLAGELFVTPATDGAGATLLEELTPRELEVLQLLAEGLSNKTIAQRLQVSDHTVKFHVNAILGKLGAQSRTEAVVRATRMGLVVL